MSLLLMFMVSYMKIVFTNLKLHLVITPLDIRFGFSRLSEIVLIYLHINVKKGRD